ncbi:hypothetical protein [Marinimicrococcus flavescens]|uniref:Uncharacterized protein n=1 Tax=Marinimicrococcus flavescens TaxID=3031815 RepID=A0AAP3XQP3_9PROT|nr:hypothetical protein [Marinimicrococcus flavescens]
MSSENIRVGQIVMDRKLPRHVWKVTEASGDLYRLERVDMPGAIRFPDARALRERYVCEEQVARM